MTGKDRSLRGETVRPTEVLTLPPVCRKSMGDEESIADEVSCCSDRETKQGTSPEELCRLKFLRKFLPALVVRK